MDPFTIMFLLIGVLLCILAIIAIHDGECTYWDDEHGESWKDRNG